MSINAMTVSAGDALKTLLHGWKMQKDHGVHMSYMMHGKPGVGKTQIAEALAREIGGKLYDIRLTTIEQSDLRGLPFYDHETGKTKWYRPEDLPDDPNEPAVLFLDELTAASPFLQPTVYGLLQERRVGMHKIPDNVFILAAGNQVEDGAVAYEMGTAISDRLVHMIVTPSDKDWIENYAIPNNLHPAVVAFIKTRPDYFMTHEDAMNRGHMIAATPRSWDRVSKIMHSAPDTQTRNILVAGTVGEHIAAEFGIVADDIAATVQVTEMIKAERADRVAMYPASMHGLNALVFGLIATVDETNVDAAIEILVDMGKLTELRPEDKEFKTMPLMELVTHAFENLITKAMDAGLAQQLLANPTMQEYRKERQELGLV